MRPGYFVTAFFATSLSKVIVPSFTIVTYIININIIYIQHNEIGFILFKFYQNH